MRSVISQEPIVGVAAVSPTEYNSLRMLAGHMKLRPAEAVAGSAVQEGYAVRSQRALVLPNGKVVTAFAL